MIPEALPVALALARRFEGFFPKPYLCPAGVPTIGYGTIRYEDGTAVTLADKPITRERAEELLQFEMRQKAVAVARLCPGINTEGRVAALTDFAFNLGVGALRGSTLRKRVLAGRWEDVPAELAKWVHGGGRRLPGLVRRRAAEAELV